MYLIVSNDWSSRPGINGSIYPILITGLSRRNTGYIRLLVQFQKTRCVKLSAGYTQIRGPLITTTTKYLFFKKYIYLIKIRSTTISEVWRGVCKASVINTRVRCAINQALNTVNGASASAKKSSLNRYAGLLRTTNRDCLVARYHSRWQFIPIKVGDS